MKGLFKYRTQHPQYIINYTRRHFIIYYMPFVIDLYSPLYLYESKGLFKLLHIFKISSYFYSIVLTYTFIGMVRNKLMYYRMSICSIFYTVVAIHSTVYKIIRLAFGNNCITYICQVESFYTIYHKISSILAI